jgi:hypothetical protein
MISLSSILEAGSTIRVRGESIAADETSCVPDVLGGIGSALVNRDGAASRPVGRRRDVGLLLAAASLVHRVRVALLARRHCLSPGRAGRRRQPGCSRSSRDHDAEGDQGWSDSHVLPFGRSFGRHGYGACR